MYPKLMIAAVSAAAIFISCTPKADPFALQKSALEEKIAQENGTVLLKVTYDTFAVVDSASFADEFAMRRNVFTRKLDSANDFAEKYYIAGQFQKMSEKKAVAASAQRILDGLDSIEESMGEDVKKTAYHDYRFTAHFKTEKGKIDAVDYYACITPDGVVLKYAAKQKDLHKVTGRVIPGYLELVGKDDAE